MADAKGSGVPLAFLLIRTSKDAQSGAKQAVLERFLGQLKLRGVEPEFTLSDKDWSEINAMRATWPEAKHQLCFWHALRALKQRLAKKKDTPAPYDSEAAHREFNIIDPAFVPLGQRCDNGDLEAWEMFIQHLIYYTYRNVIDSAPAGEACASGPPPHQWPSPCAYSFTS